MSALGTLFVGLAALISSLVSAAALVISMRRGSDRENRRSATAALEVVQENALDSVRDAENVVVIDSKREAETNDH